MAKQDDKVTFELRTMKQNVGIHAVGPSCVLCVICVVCSALQADEFGVPDLASPVTA